MSQLVTTLQDFAQFAGQFENTSIYPTGTVINAAYSADRVLVSGKDGYYEPALKVPGVTYNNGDLVMLLYVKGTEPIAILQGPGSGGGGGGGGWPYSNVFTVDPTDADANFPTIQDGINSIAAGDSIVLLVGCAVYVENLTINNRSVSIIGMGGDARMFGSVNYVAIDGTVTINATTHDITCSLENVEVALGSITVFGQVVPASFTVTLNCYRLAMLNLGATCISTSGYAWLILNECWIVYAAGTVISLNQAGLATANVFHDSYVYGTVNVGASTILNIVNPKYAVVTAGAGTVNYRDKLAGYNVLGETPADGEAPVWVAASSRFEFLPAGGGWKLGSDVLVVGPEGDYATVALAIAAAGAGDTILLDVGTWTCSAQTLPAGVNLIGVDKEACILRTTTQLTTLDAGNGSYIANVTIQNEYSVNAATVIALNIAAGVSAELFNVKAYANNANVGATGAQGICNNDSALLRNCDAEAVSGAGSAYAFANYGTTTIYDGSYFGGTSGIWTDAASTTTFRGLPTVNGLAGTGTTVGIYINSSGNMVPSGVLESQVFS